MQVLLQDAVIQYMSGSLRVYFVDDADLADVYDKLFLPRPEIENTWAKTAWKHSPTNDTAINLVYNKICNISTTNTK